MPLGPGRRGVGVIGAPVAKAAVVTAAVTPGPSPVAKAADVTLTTWNSSTPTIPLYGDFLEGRISQLFLIDLLYLGILFRTGAQTAKNLQATGLALERHYRRRGTVED